jgi:hypothetical protein
MAEDGNPDAQRLLKNLKSMPQDEFDAEFTQLLGSSKGGGSAKGSPKGDAKKGEAPEKAAKGEPATAPKGKTAAAPKEMKSAKEGIKPVENYPTNPMKFESEYPKEFAARVQELEEEGMDNGDAQGVAMAEVMTGEFSGFFKNKATAQPQAKASDQPATKPAATPQATSQADVELADLSGRDKADNYIAKNYANKNSEISKLYDSYSDNTSVDNISLEGFINELDVQIEDYRSENKENEARALENERDKIKNNLRDVNDRGNRQAERDAATPQAPSVAPKRTKTYAGDLYNFAKENKNNQSLTQAIIDFENTAESGEFNLEKFQEYLDKKSEDPDLSDDEKEFYENAHSQVEDELRTLVGMDRREPKQSDDAEFNANQEIINQRDTNDKAKQELFKQSDNLVDSYKKQGQSVTEAVNSAYEEALAMAGGEDSDLLKTIRGQYSDLLRNKTLRPQDNLRDEIANEEAAKQEKARYNAAVASTKYDLVKKGEKFLKPNQSRVAPGIPASELEGVPEFTFEEAYGESEATPNQEFTEGFNAENNQFFILKDKDGNRYFVNNEGYDYARYHAPIDDKATKPAAANTPNKPISPAIENLDNQTQVQNFVQEEAKNNPVINAYYEEYQDFYNEEDIDLENFAAFLEAIELDEDADAGKVKEIRDIRNKITKQMRDIETQQGKPYNEIQQGQATPTGSAAEQGTDIYDFARENSNNQTISTYVSEFETYANDGEFTLPKFQEYLEMMSQDQDAPKSQRDDYAEKAALVAAELEFKTNYKTVPVKEAPAAVNELVEANPEIKQELNTILSFMQSSAKSKSIETANEWFMQNGRDFIDSYSGDPKDRQKMSQAYSELKKKLGIL